MFKEVVKLDEPRWKCENVVAKARSITVATVAMVKEGPQYVNKTWSF